MPEPQVKVKLEAPVSAYIPAPAYFSAFFASLIGTLGSHYQRVLLNQSVLHTNAKELFLASLAHWRTGIFINLTRGFSVLSLQSIAKYEVSQLFPADSAKGKAAGIFAAAFAGTFVATFVETPFIRKTTFALGNPQGYRYFRFSRALSTCYLARETGFSIAAFGSRDLPIYYYLPAFFASAFVTSIFHRYAAIEGTADIPKKYLMPNFKRDGIAHTIKAIAKGQAYDHPSFKVPIPFPTTTYELTKNFLSVSCNRLTFACRVLHLGSFTMIYNFGLDVAPRLLQRFSLFQTKNPAIVEAVPLQTLKPKK